MNLGWGGITACLGVTSLETVKCSRSSRHDATSAQKTVTWDQGEDRCQQQRQKPVVQHPSGRGGQSRHCKASTANDWTPLHLTAGGWCLPRVTERLLSRATYSPAGMKIYDQLRHLTLSKNVPACRLQSVLVCSLLDVC